MTKIIEKAKAKINLTLNIVGKNPDGYHELETVMQTVSFGDVVEIEKSDKISIEVCGNEFSCPNDETNIAYKAVSEVAKYTRKSIGANIKIYKNIPVCGGFGGGSSDAAAVLRGLNSLYGLGLDVSELERIAFNLGADVPFAVDGGTKLCKGRGEKITPVSVPDMLFCLASPKKESPTGKMFKMFDETHTDVNPKNSEKFLECKTVYDSAKYLHNDFTDICISFCPEIKDIFSEMKKYGALGVALTGSGSGVFGVFDDESKANKAVSAVRRMGFFAEFAKKE